MLSVAPLLLTLRDPVILAGLFSGAVLIDFDHCFDFYLRFKRPTFSVTELSVGLAPYHKFILPFHSFEFLFCCALLTSFINSTFMAAFTAGVVIHWGFDIITNGYHDMPKSLSLVYRVKNWWTYVCLNTQ